MLCGRRATPADQCRRALRHRLALAGQGCLLNAQGARGQQPGVGADRVALTEHEQSPRTSSADGTV